MFILFIKTNKKELTLVQYSVLNSFEPIQGRISHLVYNQFLLNLIMSTPHLKRLQKAKQLLEKHRTSDQLCSESYTEIKINLKGLKYIQDPETGEKLSLAQKIKMKLQDSLINYQNMLFSSKAEDGFLITLIIKNTATMMQVYQFVRNRLKHKFGEKNFENQTLQLYCQGKLIAGSQNLSKIKDITDKYQTNLFTCERMDTFGDIRQKSEGNKFFSDFG